MGNQNLYEYQNQFKLIDVEGVVLAPLGEIIIREPQGFSDVEITLERDSDNHGVHYEFSDADTPFGFDKPEQFVGATEDPFTLLLAIFNTKGVDGKCVLQFLTRNDTGDAYDLQYEANLDFETLQVTDSTVNLLARRINLDDLFRTRMDAPIAFDATKSIDGDNVTGLTPSNMFLHGKFIEYEELSTSISTGVVPFLTTVTDWIFQFGFGALKYNNGDDVVNGSTSISTKYGEASIPNFTDVAQENLESANFSFENVMNFSGRFHTTSWRNSYQIVISGYDPDPFTASPKRLGVYVSINGVETELLADGTVFPEVLTNVFIDVNDLISFDFNVKSGDRVFFYEKWEMEGILSVSTYSYNADNGTGIDPADEFEATLETVNESSTSEVYNPFEAFNHILECVNNEADMLISDFFSTKANEIYLTNGYNIRGFANREPIIDFDTLFSKWAQRFFGLGYAIVKADSSIVSVNGSFDAGLSKISLLSAPNLGLVNGDLVTVSESAINDGVYTVDSYSYINDISSEIIVQEAVSSSVIEPFKISFTSDNKFKVLIERYDHFYQDNEVDAFTSIEDDTFEITIDKDYIFNEIKVGYKDYPKSTDENKSNNLDEFNTEQSLITPVRTVKKKADYISDVIASGYKIENQRREQFKEVPSDTVSDDDKIFAIKGITSDEYVFTENVITSSSAVNNTITVNVTFMDFQIGDVVTINAAASSLNGVYTIEGITFDGTSVIYTMDSVSVSIFGSTSATFTRSVSRLRANRNEEFDVVNNVFSPETIYNGGLFPKYGLLNQSLLINSGFNPKPDTDVVKTQDYKLNDSAEFQFKAGEGDYNLDPDKELLSVQGDVALSQINSYNRLFNGLLIKFTTSIKYSRLLLIRDAYLSQAVSNYGYISVTAPDGIVHRGFLMSMTYNPLSEKVDFVLRGKFDPAGSSFDYVIEEEMN